MLLKTQNNDINVLPSFFYVNYHDSKERIYVKRFTMILETFQYQNIRILKLFTYINCY